MIGFAKSRFSKALTLLFLFTLSFANLFSAPVRTARADDAGYALAFDGVNDNVKLAYTSSMLASTWKDTKTVELWVKPEGSAAVCTNGVPIECDKIFSDKPMWWGISRGIANNGQDRIWVYNVDSNLDYIGIPYTAGEWVHIALVHSGGVLRAYKNGVEVANRLSGTTSQPYNGALPVLYLGAVIVTSSRYYPFEGQIDEVRLWNVARSAAEIQANMQHELVGDEAGLAAYYRMSDGAGTTLTDDSINNWNGTLYDGGSGLPGNGTLPQWVPSGAFGTLPPTATFTPTATPTFTPEPPTATPTFTPVVPTDTPTFTPLPPTDTPTYTPEPPTASPTPLPPGDAGNALSFDGVNDFVAFTYTSSMLASTWTSTKTVEFWYKPEGAASTCPYNIAIECGKVFGDKPMWWGVSRGIVNGRDRLWVYNVDGNLDTVEISYTPDEWVHIAMVHSGGVMVAYKNGVEVGRRASGTTQQPYSGARPVLQIGGVIVTGTRYYMTRGQIDELRLWNVARSAAEIQGSMLHELAGDEAGLAAYYRMSDGAGTTLTDDSLNNWNGTLYDGCCGLPANGILPQWVPSGAFGMVQPIMMAAPELPAAMPTATPTFTPEPATATPTLTPELSTDTTIFTPTFTPEPPTATPTFTPEPPTDTPTFTPELPTDTPTYTPEPPTPTL